MDHASRQGRSRRRRHPRRRPGGDVTASWVTFTPARNGTYQLRARLRDKAAGKASGFSPASTLKVS